LDGLRPPEVAALFALFLKHTHSMITNTMTMMAPAKHPAITKIKSEAEIYIVQSVVRKPDK
jgi:hypothetical protein